MAESQKARPKSPFSHIKDSIMSTKNKYKPLESQDVSNDTSSELKSVSEINNSSMATKKIHGATKASVEAATRVVIKNWDGWKPVKEDGETNKEVQAEENKNGSLYPSSETTQENSGGKKKGPKKGSKKGSMATVVGSVGSVVGSVVTRDCTMSD